MSILHVTPAAVLAAVRAGDDTLDKLAETFDVPWSSFTLRRTVNELRDAGLVRLSGNWVGSDDYRIEAA